MMSSSVLCFLFLPDLSLDLEFDFINFLPHTKNIWIRKYFATSFKCVDHIRLCFHRQLFFDKVGLSQKNMLV